MAWKEALHNYFGLILSQGNNTNIIVDAEQIIHTQDKSSPSLSNLDLGSL